MSELTTTVEGDSTNKSFLQKIKDWGNKVIKTFRFGEKEVDLKNKHVAIGAGTVLGVGAIAMKMRKNKKNN